MSRTKAMAVGRESSYFLIVQFPVDSSIHPKHLYCGLNMYQSLWYVWNCNREQSRDTEHSHPMDVRMADRKV